MNLIITRRAAFMLLGSLIGVGCGHDSQSPPPNRINVILDATTPERFGAMRVRVATVLTEFNNKACAGIYLLDQECTEVYSPDQQLPSGFEKTLELLIKRVKPSSQHGTFPHIAWKKLADEAPQDSRPAIFLWESDGDQDDSSAYAREVTRHSIKSLAAQTNVKLVIVIGVSRDQRDRVRKELMPFGRRGVLLEGDVPANEIKSRITQALVVSPTQTSGGAR